MSLGRLLALAIVLVVAWWVFTKSGLFTRSEPGAAMDSGARRERWIYSSVGKTVTFENGVVVSIQ